jgi:hypothetical protein
MHQSRRLYGSLIFPACLLEKKHFSSKVVHPGLCGSCFYSFFYHDAHASGYQVVKTGRASFLGLALRPLRGVVLGDVREARVVAGRSAEDVVGRLAGGDAVPFQTIGSFLRCGSVARLYMESCRQRAGAARSVHVSPSRGSF